MDPPAPLHLKYALLWLRNNVNSVTILICINSWFNLAVRNNCLVMESGCIRLQAEALFGTASG